MKKTGCIIGRFQVPELSDGHKHLIKQVMEKNDYLIILLGVSPLLGDSRNPLSFETREKMVMDFLSSFRTPVKFSIVALNDCHNDCVWSEQVDKVILRLVSDDNVTIYGSRDSFIGHYHGCFPIEYIPSLDGAIAGTDIRNRVSNGLIHSTDFRRGVIWSAANRWPTNFVTVDAAIIENDSRLLLGRKPNEEAYRFIGGFSSVESASLEDDVLREVREEAGFMELGKPEYIGSVKIDDWRYRKSRDKITTTFWLVPYLWGAPKAGDDICEVKWFDIRSIEPEHHIVNGHRPLFQMLRTYLGA